MGFYLDLRSWLLWSLVNSTCYQKWCSHVIGLIFLKSSPWSQNRLQKAPRWKKETKKWYQEGTYVLLYQYIIIRAPYTCVAINFFLPNLCSNRQLEPPLPLNFSYRIFRHYALAPNFSIDPIFRKGDMGSLVYSRECVEATAVFRDLLPSRPRRRNLKMWFQALEFAVSCTVAKYIFYCRRTRTRTYQFFFLNDLLRTYLIHSSAASAV